MITFDNEPVIFVLTFYVSDLGKTGDDFGDGYISAKELMVGKHVVSISVRAQ